MQFVLPMVVLCDSNRLVFHEGCL